MGEKKQKYIDMFGSFTQPFNRLQITHCTSDETIVIIYIPD